MNDAAPGAVASSRRVAVPGGLLHVRDQPGASPAIVMMHGFPDDSRIYDRLTPLLAPQRAVAFDWLGYGHSSRTEAKRFTPAEHQAELGTVLDTLAIRRAVLVGHDASGPDAISYALRRPQRVAHLVLLNTYYGNAPALRFPEMIQLFADERLTPLADAIVADPAQRLWLLQHSADRFGYETQQSFDPHGVAVTSVLPQFFGGEHQPDALGAIRRWTRALPGALREHDTIIANGELARLEVPVTLIFGSRDEYLSPALATHLASLFAHSTVQLVGGASHWPQYDQPEAVAQMIRKAAMRHTSAHEPGEGRSSGDRAAGR
jgi:pimeloyl-ACP methyl ester carboxylesterase